MEKFLELNSLPLPLLDESKEHYLKFEEVFGKPISEADQPSLVAVPTDEQKQTGIGHCLLLPRFVQLLHVENLISHVVSMQTQI